MRIQTRGTRLALGWMLWLFLSVACTPTDDDGGSDGTDTEGGGLGAMCSAQKPCPSGQFCFNGVCAMGCNNNGDCAADQYCDTSEFGDRLCHNKTVTTCPQTPCAESQVCVNGMCSTPPPPTKCDPTRVASGQDGCEKTALCLDPEQKDEPRCYSFSACAQDGTCPVGLEGAVCNDGLIPDKARICLSGLCKDDANCPSAWNCVRFASNDPVGLCSQGTNMTPCNVQADCLQGNSCVKGSASDFSGFCSDGKQGSFCTDNNHCQSGQCASAPGFMGGCF